MPEVKKRVKCANCGMIYDITIPHYSGVDPDKVGGKCPRCGSNAFNELTRPNTWR